MAMRFAPALTRSPRSNKRLLNRAKLTGILITTESSLCSRRYLDGQAIAPAVFAMGDGLDLVP